jgi:hypothetical protein
LYLVTLHYDPILYLMIKLDLELGRDCTVFEARRDSLAIDLFISNCLQALEDTRILGLSHQDKDFALGLKNLGVAEDIRSPPSLGSRMVY